MTEWSWMRILMEGVGILGILMNILAFQCKKHKGLVALKSANEACFGIQYLFLGAYTGALMNAISVLRNVIFAHRVSKEKSNLFYQVLFSVIFTVLGILSWDGPKSAMVIVAKILSTVAYGIKNTATVRLLSLPSSVAWLIYNFAVGTVAGTANEAFTLGSLVLGILRLDLYPWWKKRKEAK